MNQRSAAGCKLQLELPQTLGPRDYGYTRSACCAAYSDVHLHSGCDYWCDIELQVDTAFKILKLLEALMDSADQHVLLKGCIHYVAMQ